jgi:2-dehydropantoate 2-reductase
MTDLIRDRKSFYLYSMSSNSLFNWKVDSPHFRKRISGGGRVIKIIILGAGALGSLIGGLIAESGLDVTLIARPKHVEAVKERGLIIRGPRGTRKIDVKATDDPKRIRGADTLILTTKMKDSEEALNDVSHLSSSLKLCLSLQNGLTKNEALTERYGRDKVIGAASTEGATLLNYGEIEHTITGITFFGALGGEGDGIGAENSEKMKTVFNNAGLRAEIVEDIKSAEWAKLIRMASGAALSILTRLEYHKILKNFDISWCCIELMRELANIAKADSVELRDYPAMPVTSLTESPLEDAIMSTVQTGRKIEESGMTHVKISALQDVERGKKTEVEELLGYPLSIAKRLNVVTPRLEFVYRLIRGLDSYLI